MNPFNKEKFFRWAPLSPKPKNCKLDQLYMLYSNAVSFWHYQGITNHYYSCICYFVLYIKSAKKKCTSSLWIRWKNKRKKNQFLILWLWLFPIVLWLALNFLVIAEGKNDIIRFVSTTRVNVILSHSPNHCCFRFHHCRLHRYRLYHRVAKVHFQLRLFPLILFVADQFLQDSAFGEASVF